MNRSWALAVVGAMLLMAACKPGTPGRYIQPDDMEDILVDYYLARAMAQQDNFSQGERDYNMSLYTAGVLKKHGVTQAEFDSALVYYYTRSDRFEPIFKRVADRLEEKALVMGASEGEIGKYAAYNATGDTANIWADRPVAVMMPIPPYNRWEFNIEADSTFRRGDALMMMFTSDFMYQGGEKRAWLYMAVEYGDTVVGRNLRFSSTGLSQLRVPEDTVRTIKGIKGFFYLDGGFETTANTRLLFLNNVQLIRFHTLDAATAADSAVIAAPDSLATALPADSLNMRDSVRSTIDTIKAMTITKTDSI